MSDRSRGNAGSRIQPKSKSMRPQLSDEQWAMASDLFTPPKPSQQGGRPRADSRACVEGVLWGLRSGAHWKDLPSCFPSYPTCWRRFVEWTTDGTLDRVHRRLIQLLDGSGQINWEDGFADGTFASATAYRWEN
jgi:transposase